MSPPADALSQSIDCTFDVARGAATGEVWPWLFARCWMFADRFEHHGRAPMDLAAALTGFARLPADAPGRARLAAVLITAQVRTGALRAPEHVERAAELVVNADADPGPLPGWPGDRATVRRGHRGCPAAGSLGVRP